MRRQIMLLLLGCLGPTVAFAAEAIDYTAQIAPIFTKYCTGCHNPDDPQGKLSLDSFANVQQGGEHGAALTPGQSASSRLIQMLTGKLEPKMPPEDNEAPSEEEVKLLIAWIDAGAKGPEGEEPRPTLLTPKLPPAPVAKGITALALSPQGTLLAVGRLGEVELRSVGGVIRRLSPLPGKVNAVHFSADGKLLVTASGITGLYGSAGLWNVETGEQLREFIAHRDVLYDAELSPDGQVLATCSYDRRVILWNAQTGEQLRVLEGHNDAVYDLAFSPDGSVLATASGDETVKLWQVATGQRLDTLHQPQAEQYVVTFSPEGRYVLAAGADNRIRVWRFVSRDRQRINPLVHARFAHEGAIVGLAFTRDGQRLISAAEDRTLKLWETKNYTQVHLFESQPDEITGVAASPWDDTFTVSRIDGSLSNYNVPPPQRVSAPSVTHAPAAESVAATTAPMQTATDDEPNDTLEQATSLTLPARISGVIHREGQATDVDLFRFAARAGEEWVIEINAARQKSPLDSRVEVLDAQGQPIPRVLLQAVRDSYFTFRGKDSDTSDDFRVHNWQEMDLNQYLYANGEVVKLWHYPRGPDSGFQVYPGRGKRFTYFDTTASSHPLGGPCYIVEPHPPGTALIPNGLPVFTVYYENDDDSRRAWGADSRLTFQAPADGEYFVRLADARGFAGADYKYELTIRPRQPDFKVTLGGANPTIALGSGREFNVTVDRLDDFEGEIRVDISGLPPGFHVTTPLVIEAGQTMAWGTINTLPDTPPPTAENAKASQVTATAVINGREVTHEVNNFGEIKLGEKPKVLVKLLAADENASEPTPDRPLELVMEPGSTIVARVRVERNGYDGRVELGKADAGRNLPHGVYVDNIGLNGLLIVEGQDERTFFITAAEFVPETTRMFHLMTENEGNQTSWPAILHVRRPDTRQASN